MVATGDTNHTRMLTVFGHRNETNKIINQIHTSVHIEAISYIISKSLSKKVFSFHRCHQLICNFERGMETVN